MACVKPPAEVTAPVASRGPTQSAAASTAPPDTGHVFHAELDREEGTFGGGHHAQDGPTLYIRDAPSGLAATEVIIDAKSGNSRVKATFKDEQGNIYTKKTHSMFNPQLSQPEVVAEIHSVLSDPNSDSDPIGEGPDSRIKVTGVSHTGAELIVILESDGTIVTAYPALSHLKFKRK